MKKTLMVCFAAIALLGCGGSGDDDNGISGKRLYILYWDGFNQVLAEIDADSPQNVDDIGSFNHGGDAVTGLDFRPADGFLYSVEDTTSDVLRINPNTGSKSTVGTHSNNLDFALGFDINPVVDRIRVVDPSDHNARLNPNNGSTTATDTDINPDSDLVAAAYTNNFAGAGVTTLYAIDDFDDALVRVGGIDGGPSPNGGQVTFIGSLGVDVPSDTQFDIDDDGRAWMLVSQSNGAGFDNDLYEINLNTGDAVFVGTLNLNFQVVGMTADEN